MNRYQVVGTSRGFGTEPEWIEITLHGAYFYGERGKGGPWKRRWRHLRLVSLEGEILASAKKQGTQPRWSVAHGDDIWVVDRIFPMHSRQVSISDGNQGLIDVSYFHDVGVWRQEESRRRRVRTHNGWAKGELSVEDSLPTPVVAIAFRLALGDWISMGASQARMGQWLEEEKPQPDVV